MYLGTIQMPYRSGWGFMPGTFLLRFYFMPCIFNVRYFFVRHFSCQVLFMSGTFHFWHFSFLVLFMSGTFHVRSFSCWMYFSLQILFMLKVHFIPGTFLPCQVLFMLGLFHVFCISYFDILENVIRSFQFLNFVYFLKIQINKHNKTTIITKQQS